MRHGNLRGREENKTMPDFVNNYEGSTTDRRQRDRKPFDPKRRASDNRIKHEFISAREEELLKLIDIQIFRIWMERQKALDAATEATQ
jgi:hypothetical protein